MECEKFVTWLENRDTHDISEADQARRHAAHCDHCRKLLAQDEALEHHISGMLAREATPTGLQNKVDLNLDRMQPKRGRKGVWALVAACCIMLLAVLPFQGWLPDNREGLPVLSVEQLGDYILADYQDHGDGGMGFEPVTDAAVWLKENLHTSQLPPKQIIAGYTIQSARFCYLGQCLAVHLIYEKGGRYISIFVVEKKNVDADFDSGRLYTVAAGPNDIVLSRKSEYLYAAIGM